MMPSVAFALEGTAHGSGPGPKNCVPHRECSGEVDRRPTDYHNEPPLAPDTATDLVADSVQPARGRFTCVDHKEGGLVLREVLPDSWIAQADTPGVRWTRGD